MHVDHPGTTGTCPPHHAEANTVYAVPLEREELESPCSCRYEVRYDEYGHGTIELVHKCEYCYREYGEYVAELRACWERVGKVLPLVQRHTKHDGSNRKRVLLEFQLPPAPHDG